MPKDKNFEDPCDICGGEIVWKIEKRTEEIDEWIGICSDCGATYTTG